MKFAFQIFFSVFLCFSFYLDAKAELSPYGTGFALGTKEDLEIRLEWAKKDPCFKHGFGEMSLEFLELKKYLKTKNGPNAPMPKCSKK